jgi:hypothetical protein
MKQSKIRLYQNRSQLNKQSVFLIKYEYFRTQFEGKQADDSEPIQTSRVVTDEVKN